MRWVFETTISVGGTVPANAAAGVVPLDAMCLILARMELSGRQEHVINRVIVRAVKARPPALQPFDQAVAGGLVTTAALPIHQLA